jgi:[ribosomal protein S18]-alanine N-acetyltransferase
MSAVKIREAQAADLDAILEIERGNPSAAHWNESEYLPLFREAEIHRLALIAEHADAVAGFVIAREVAGEWELENVAVAPRMQRQEIGSALLSDLCDRVRSAGGTKLLLEVRESNAAARKLYEGQGFHLTGRRKNYYSNPEEDALLFEKNFPELSVKIR